MAGDVKPELTRDEIDHLINSDSSLIGLMIAARYAVGGNGISLARDIRDVIHAMRKRDAALTRSQP